MSGMSFGLTSYMIVWMLACLAAVAIMVRNRQRFWLLERTYRRFLLRPWRLVVFGVALVGMVVIAPYSGDPTWDYFDAASCVS